MADKQFLEYMENVVSLEKAVYTQTQTMNQLAYQINQLGYHYDLQKPCIPGRYSTNYLEGTASLAGAGIVLGGIIGLFTGGFFTALVIGAIIGAIAAVLFNVHDVISTNSERKRDYEKALRDYNVAFAADKKRVDAELVKRKRLYELWSIMERKRNETTSLLNQFYSKNIIFPKYRNMIAVCSIYEYFISGRCSELTGHEGAYNIYETEVRLNAVLTKLDEVVQKLEEIKANQYMLYDAIQEGNQTMQRLAAESEKQTQLAEFTADNTSVAAYYSAQTANEANQIKWLAVFDSCKRNN